MTPASIIQFASFSCPLCGAALQVGPAATVREFHTGYHVAGRRLPQREEETTAALCSGCEFGIDLEHQGRAPRSQESLEAEIRLMMRGLATPVAS